MTARTHTKTVDYADAVLKLRRCLRRAVRTGLPGPALTASETELLALVARTQGIGVAEAADSLQVAPNTVSTLVGRLSQEGLLHRRRDHRDRRAARLGLTPAGEARIAEVRRRRAAILDDAFDRLSAEDRALLLDSLPALEHLVDALAGEVDAP